MKEGEAFGWDALLALDPEEVTKRTGVPYDRETGSYTILVYGHPVQVSTATKTFEGAGDQFAAIIGRYAYFSKISILSYLVNAKNVPPTGHQIKPTADGALEKLFQGSHALPLDGISARWDGQPDKFIEKGQIYNGVRGELGDISLKLEPFARLPVELVLWFGDDEFPARGDLLFDSTCNLHVPPDIIWSVAMMSILLLF